MTVHPSPAITWYHKGQKIEFGLDETKYVETKEKGLYAIEIFNCTEADTGEIMVVAKNDYGDDTCKAVLTVKRKCLPSDAILYLIYSIHSNNILFL